jgi:hypothetical protein
MDNPYSLYRCLDIATSSPKAAQWPMICQKKIFTKNFNIGTNNPEFDADFESVEKVAKKVTRRKLEGLELLYRVLKGENVHKFYTFMLMTFL